MKKKVIFVYTNFGIGGIAKSLLEVLRILDYSKYEITLYIRRNDVLDLLSEIPSGVKIITVENKIKLCQFSDDLNGKFCRIIYDILKKKHRYLAKRWNIICNSYQQVAAELKNKFIFETQYDVAISYSTDDDVPGFVYKYIKAKKKYVFVHQSTPISKRNLRYMRKYDKIILVNPLLRSWMENLIGKKNEQICIIENYVNAERVIKQSKEVNLEKKEGVFCIATCGRLCYTKGFDYVIEAAHILSKKGCKFCWYWIGDGPNRKEMETSILLNGLGDKVRITGFLTNPYPYMAMCDVYVQPSRNEAYCLAMIEALALGKMIISTKTAGGGLIIDKYKCGMLVDDPIEDVANIVYTFSTSIQNEIFNNGFIDFKNEQKRFIKEWEDLLEAK